ncbi:MAG: DNA repair protein RecO [Alphaproteobacteria bacterium]|nr:DNA repair protein RecO [Alphaproteobacteria bacterium]
MKIESVGILIGLRPLNERDSVAHIFTRDNGVLVGVMRGAQVAKKNKPLVGQVGQVAWNARLDSQLGVFHWEAEKNIAAGYIAKPTVLMCLNSVFELLLNLLPEREAYTDLYDNTVFCLENLDSDVQVVYLRWEINFLQELGYALDLSHCSGCGTTRDLNYLSPRTGRAVCNKCAQPYITKLYTLPLNLDVTYHFLDSICLQQGVRMPLMRKILKK